MASFIKFRKWNTVLFPIEAHRLIEARPPFLTQNQRVDDRSNSRRGAQNNKKAYTFNKEV